MITSLSKNNFWILLFGNRIPKISEWNITIEMVMFHFYYSEYSVYLGAEDFMRIYHVVQFQVN